MTATIIHYYDKGNGVDVVLRRPGQPNEIKHFSVPHRALPWLLKQNPIRIFYHRDGGAESQEWDVSSVRLRLEQGGQL